MIVLGLLQLFLIVAIALYEYKYKSPIVFLWATLFMMFGIMHVISYCLPNYTYEKDVLDEASWFVILFCLIYILTRSILRKIIKCERTESDTSNIIEERILFWSKVVLFVSVSIYAFFVIQTSGSLFAVSKDKVYETMAKGSLVFLLSTYLYYASAPVFLYCFKRKRVKDALFVGVLVIVRSLLSCSRMDMIILFVGVISCIILNSRKKMMGKIMVLGVLGLFALVAIYALRTFRYYYGFSRLGSIEAVEFINHMIDFVKNDDGELGLRKIFYYFVQHNNEFEGFGTGNGYKRVLLLVIPSRFAFGLKPEDMCAVMGRAWRPDFKGIITLTVTPTLFGDCYANFGFLGCFLGAFWAFVGTITDYIVNRRTEIIKLILFGLIGLEYIDIGRGSIYNPLCHIWYCGIIITFVYFLGRVKLGSSMKFIIRTRC